MANDEMTVFQRHARLAGGVLVMALLAACSVQQPYERPAAAMPAAFKEAGTAWKAAEPAEEADRGQWWAIFGDPVLDGLEHQAAAANQDLRAAAARVQQARALAQVARADRLPTLDANVGPARERLSAAAQGGTPVPAQTLWRARAAASYEVDLFGRVAGAVDAASAEAARSEALLRSVQLALQADVAQEYFALREADAQLELYRQTVALRDSALALVERRFGEGETGELDVARARTELATAQADAAGVARGRAATEHRLAVLLGQAPAGFALAAQPLVPTTAQVPAVLPTVLPSALLERRPDIAAAERAMAAAHARVGMARSAFFPRLDLSGAAGYEAASLGDLFQWSGRAFAVGAALSLPLVDGGRRSAAVDGARAQFDEAVAQYRQQVLVAFREVEDSLADLRLLDEQTRAQSTAVVAAQRAGSLSQTQYGEGQVAYLEVIDAQRQVLQAQLQLNQLAGAHAAATVALVRALGGGWQASPPQLATR